MAMNMTTIITILAGATVLYAGVLSLADDLYIGAGMIMLGGLAAALPIYKAFRKPAVSRRQPPAKHGRKAHLTVVEDAKERPTYH